MRTARDIMQEEVISIRPDSTVRELVQLLDDEGISGVPVLDSTGRIQGVVSRTDVVRVAAREPEVSMGEAFWTGVGIDLGGSEEEDPDAYFLAPESSVMLVPGRSSFEMLPLDDLRVEEIMTPVAFNVDPEMLIWELAKFLVKGRIHRALVVEEGRLVGIVTAFDVLRVVAGDAEG